ETTSSTNLASRSSTTARPIPTFVPLPLNVSTSGDPEMDRRLDSIVNMTRSAWSVYARYAWGDESLRSVSNRSNFYEFGPNSGRTIVASLSTLWAMGLKAEFEQGKSWVERELDLGRINRIVTVFELVTDYMGGLLSAYSLTGDEMFASKAKAIADRLAPAYNTSTGEFNPNQRFEYASDFLSFLGIPYRWINLAKDRKSTRLNSSHVSISYAVFCLKKK